MVRCARLASISRRGLVPIVVALVFVVLITTATVTVSAAIVDFPDPGLEAAIREAIAKPTGDIHDTDLLNLTYFNAYDCNIVDLEGIQHCVNLTNLLLSNNRIVDISILSNLTNLTCLSMASNQIVDISALSGLTNITKLYLNWNVINDISVLSDLSNLTYLSLGSNRLVDISAVSGLNNLWIVNLEDNQISDIAPLVSNTGIESGDYVEIQLNQLSPVLDLADIQAIIDRNVNVVYEPPPFPSVQTHPSGIHDEYVMRPTMPELDIVGNFDNQTTFRVEGYRSEQVQALRLMVFNILGERMLRVFAQEITGKELKWHTVDDAGAPMENGVYIYKVDAKIKESWYCVKIWKVVILR